MKIAGLVGEIYKQSGNDGRASKGVTEHHWLYETGKKFVRNIKFVIQLIASKGVIK